MSFMQSVPEALSDPLPRIYVCFCNRRFTTYPGIYLHLKTKHDNLFFKYKQLKITKLFRKMYDEDNNEIYRLQDLGKRQSHYNGVNQKIKNIKKSNKDQSSARRQEDSVKINNLLDFHPHPQTKPNQFIRIHQHAHRPRKVIENQLLTFDFKSNNHPSLFTQNNIQFGSPFSAQSHYFSFNPYLSRQPSIKQIMESYLLSSKEQPKDKILIRNSLYNLKVFIDKNYELLDDPRVKHRIFLSYCDQFEPKCIGYLLEDYIVYLQSKVQTNHLPTSDENIIQIRQMQYSLIFVEWLKDNGLISFRPALKQAGSHSWQQKNAPVFQKAQIMAENNFSQFRQ